MKKETIKKLTDIVGKEAVLTSDEDRICYSYDATRKIALPDVIVKPKNAKHELHEYANVTNRKRFKILYSCNLSIRDIRVQVFAISV